MPTFQSSCTIEAPNFHELRKVTGIGLVTLAPLSDLSSWFELAACAARTSESGHQGARQEIKIVSLSKDEHRDAVYCSLHHGSQNQPLFRVRAYAARDRALAPHGECGATRNHGATAGADGGSGIGAAEDNNPFTARLTKSMRGLL